MKKSPSIQIGKHKIRRSTKDDKLVTVEKLLEDAKQRLSYLNDAIKMGETRKYLKVEIESQKLLIHVIEAYLL